MDKQYDGSPPELLAHSSHEAARSGVSVVDCLKAIVAGQVPFRLRAHFTINVIDPADTDRGGALDLMITTSAPDLAEVIIAADAAGKLRAESREALVHTDFSIQTRRLVHRGPSARFLPASKNNSSGSTSPSRSEAWDFSNGLLSLIEPNHLPLNVDAI
jgi:hypothetical protein